MSDSKNTAIPPLPPVIRYLSRDSLQSLQLTPQEIVASIEHLILGRTAASLECVQSGHYAARRPVYDGYAGCF